MKNINFDDLSVTVSQADFAKSCGISRQAVSQYIQKGVLSRGGTFVEWIRQYVKHLEAEACKRGVENDKDVRYWRLQERKQGALLKEQERHLKAEGLVDPLAVFQILEKITSEFEARALRMTAGVKEKIEAKYNIQLGNEIMFRPVNDFLADTTAEVKRIKGWLLKN